MKKAFSVRSVFFIPLWRRLLVVGATLGWAVVEIFFGSSLWALALVGIAAYLASQFFIGFDAEALQREQDEKDAQSRQ